MQTETQIKLARGVVMFVAGTSVNFVVKTALKNVVPVDSKLQKLQLILGSATICGIASDLTCERVDGRFNDVLTFLGMVDDEEEENDS